MLLKRLDVTVQSFGWSDRAKVGAVTPRFGGPRADLTKGHFFDFKCGPTRSNLLKNALTVWHEGRWPFCLMGARNIHWCSIAPRQYFSMKRHFSI